MTIHIDQTSSEADIRRAAEILLLHDLLDFRANAAANDAKMLALVMSTVRRMVQTLHGPFEVRHNSVESEPVLVIHPRDRVLGQQRKQEAQLLDQWNTAKITARLP